MQNNRHILYILLTACTWLPGSSLWAQPYQAWTGTADFVINTSGSGANVSGSVTEFPLLIQLEGGYFDFSAVKPAGEDIRFSQNGAALAYEIEGWNPALEQASIWVRVPAIAGSNASQSITMHWGNSGAASESDGAAVFAGNNNFRGVWHLGDGGPEYADATGHNPNGNLESSSGPVSSPGVVDNCVYLDGNGHINGGTHASLDVSDTDRLTVSAWSRVDGVNAPHQGIAGKYSWEAGTGTSYYLGWSFGNFQVEFPGSGNFSGQGGTQDDTWYHVALVNDGSRLILYVDGEENASRSASGSIQAAPNAPFEIGRMDHAQYYYGFIDEVRVSDAARSAAWVKLSYENQKPGQNVVSLPVISGCTEDFGIPESIQVSEGKDFWIQGKAMCASDYAWFRLESGGAETPVATAGIALTGTAPRVATGSDVTHNYRFKALYGNEWRTADMAMEIVDSVPDPAFSLPSPFPDDLTWMGQGPLTISPAITNLNLIPDDPAFDMNYDWSVSGITVGQSLNSEGHLVLAQAESNGEINIELCLDNGGNPVCESLSIQVNSGGEPLTLLTPDGAPGVKADNPYLITWETREPGQVPAVHLHYQVEGGPWQLIGVNIPNTGYYVWHSPAIETQEAIVRVVSSTGGILDVSDEAFIISASVALLPRNPGNQVTFYLAGRNHPVISGGYNSIIISDVNGRIVRDVPILSDRVVWDLRDENGRVVSMGLYIIHLTGESGRSHHKLWVD